MVLSPFDTLNVSSNVLESFPKQGTSMQTPNPDLQGNGLNGASAATPVLASSSSYEELGVRGLWSETAKSSFRWLAQRGQLASWVNEKRLNRLDLWTRRKESVSNIANSDRQPSSDSLLSEGLNLFATHSHDFRRIIATSLFGRQQAERRCL
jgi:hypothetical protein